MTTIKEDCAGYDAEKGVCKCLRMLYCKIEVCKFYKTKEQVRSQSIASIKRRRAMNLPITNEEYAILSGLTSGQNA